MPLRSRFALVGVLVALLAGAFVWRYGDSTAPVDTTTSQGQQLVRGWREVDHALPAMSDTLPGVQSSPDGIPREGTYVVNLWASFCGPCRHEMPWLQRLHARGGVPVVGVTRDNLLSEAEKVIEQRRITYPNVRDEFGDFAQEISGVVPPQFLPSTLLVVDGTITWAHLGPFESYADLRDSVTERL